MLAKVPTSVEELAQCLKEGCRCFVLATPGFIFRLPTFVRHTSRVAPSKSSTLLGAQTVPRALPRDAHIAHTARKVPARGRGLGLYAPRYSLSRGVTTDSTPRDLRDALAEDIDPEADRTSAAATSPARTTRCWKCMSLPAPGSKLRYCGRCETATHCSKPCARADWATHKRTCEILRQSHGDALADFILSGEVVQRISTRALTILRAGFKKCLALLTRSSLWHGAVRARHPSYMPQPSIPMLMAVRYGLR
jgi:hypothetical protein